MNIKWRNDGSGLGDIEGRDDIVMHDCVHRTPIKGAKKGQDKPRRPRIAKDSVASTSTAKLLYGLAEGEVWGLVDGGKSIRLDGTPLLDDNGNTNFEGVTWDFRHGTNEQDYIKGFPDVSNETPINVELRSDNPWIKAFTDTQLSAVRVRFKWNRLSKTNPDNGDVTGYKINYAIDLQTDGGAYQEVLRTKIADKTSAGYERTHRIDLPKATTGWQIRVRRLTPNNPSEYVQDTMMIDAVAEVIDVKLRYPNTALLGVQYNAETFSSIAKLEAHVRGSIIRVPSNYDAEARTYTGIWDGTFKDAYSNNPAWVYYDLCRQWRYGLGERLDATMIDKWSLYTLGQYCDEMVSNGQGGLEPRFTCNVYLQKQADAYQVLSNIAGIFRGISYWNGEKIFADADVPQDPVYTFSRANVIDGRFEYTGTRARDRHTLAKVAWDNPLNSYQTEYEYVRDEKAMAKLGVKVLELNAFGCTSQAQAQRAGLWALKTEQLETRQVSFGAGLDAVKNITVGNIINVSDELFAGRANGGRVSTVNDTQRIIELDREVVAAAGDVLIINSGNGKSERRNISHVNGNRITVTAGFTGAEPEHVWAIETADLKLMRFRVMSITQNDDVTFNITAIQHEPQKYDAVDFGTDVKPTEITIVNPETVDAPESVTITSRHRVVQGQTVTTLVIGWAQVKDAVAYDVEWRKDDGSWIKLPRTGNVSVEIEGVYSGNYTARVRSVSAFDVQSQATTSTLTAIEGKAGLPPKIVGLTATGVLFGMDLKWGFQQGSGDADYTEIQVGSAPNVNVATLGQYSYPTNTHTINGLQGNLSQSYRARLVDKLGFKSPWSAWVTGTTDANADKVMDLIQGQIDESSLNQSLTSKIGKIADNELAISQETQNRIDAIINTKQLADEAQQAADAAQQAANNAATAAGNKGEVIFGSTAPVAAKRLPQNLWIDTTGGKNTPKRWNGSAWVVVTDKAATDALAAANQAQASANQANQSIVTILDEQEQINNELGLQHETLQGVILDYKPRYTDANRYTDASRSQNWTYWKTVAKDGYATNERITNLQSEVADSNAQLVKRIETEATATSALAREVTTLETTVGENTASLQETKEVVDGIKGEYALKLDVGNKVAGFGLVNNVGEPSAFDIRADRFSISAPVGKPNDVNGNSPFMVLTTPQNIDGVQVPAGTYMRDFYAPRGSIDTLQVADGAITTAKIGNLQVDTAQIANGAIETAKIGNAQVDTLQIRGQAVTVTDAVEKVIDARWVNPSETIGTERAYVDPAGNMVTVELYIFGWKPSGNGYIEVALTAGANTFARFRTRAGGSQMQALFKGVVTVNYTGQVQMRAIVSCDSNVSLDIESYLLTATSLKR